MKEDQKEVLKACIDGETLLKSRGYLMNERIKELYSEAVVYAFDQRFIPGVVRELQEVITEKFSELLIKEAINTIQSVGDKASNDIPFEVTDLFVSQLRQRFGVQE